ncbi:MAG: hypothetical protein JNK44_01710 [Cyclobacteriaceae bacterium]|nr:hypothetical protein [Cyclobacteriaceae bacterium]
MKLAQFTRFQIANDELKVIKGGITCSFSVTFSDGSQFSDSGSCSGSTVAECNQYAVQNCNGWAAGGATQCNYYCLA